MHSLARRVAALLLLPFLVLCAMPAAGQQPVPQQPAPQSGEALVQCVTVKWTAPGDGPRLGVEVWVFGKAVAQAELDKEHPGLDFAFEDGFVTAKGTLAAAFDPWKGTGTLTLNQMEYSCDFSGSFNAGERGLADFVFLPRFDY